MALCSGLRAVAFGNSTGVCVADLDTLRPIASLSFSELQARRKNDFKPQAADTLSLRPSDLGCVSLAFTLASFNKVCLCWIWVDIQPYSSPATPAQRVVEAPGVLLVGTTSGEVFALSAGNSTSIAHLQPCACRISCRQQCYLGLPSPHRNPQPIRFPSAVLLA